MRSFIVAAGLVAAAQAFTPPTTATWGPLTKPDLSDPVTQGETFDVTWDPQSHPTDGVTVSLVLCRGPSTNCVTDKTAIVEGVPAAAKSYSWNVPCDLPAGTQSTATGYGMLIIVDGTGEFQYSTQFSVLANDKCAGSSSSSASPSASGQSPGSWTTRGFPPSYTSGGNSTAPAAPTVAPSSWGAPSSIVYATNTPSLVTYATHATTGYASATPSAPAASTFTGAAARPTNVIGLIAGGALAMLAL